MRLHARVIVDTRTKSEPPPTRPDGHPLPARGEGTGVGRERSVGRATPLVDGIEKVTGRARYTADLPSGDALVGRILRSPVAHGVIRGIEAREYAGQIFIKVQAVGDAELEVWAAHRQSEALAEALGKKVRIEKVPYRKASAPSAALVKNSLAIVESHPAADSRTLARPVRRRA